METLWLVVKFIALVAALAAIVGIAEIFKD
jgi:hypothetical protein